MVMINCSNHPSGLWPEAQKKAAAVYGEIRDYPFPHVAPEADEKTVARMADEMVRDMAAMKPSMVMCQGEFTLTCAVVSRLKALGIPVSAACTGRKVTEEQLKDGTIKKVSQYQFVQFRRY